MANSEDVPRLRVCDEDGEVYFANHPRIREQFDALAAEVRELRGMVAERDDQIASMNREALAWSVRLAAKIDAAMGGGEERTDGE